MHDRPDIIHEMLAHVVQLFERRELHPLPYKTYPLGNVTDAFRDMAQAKHIGKLVVPISGKDVAVEPERQTVFSLQDDATYLITGGLGGFGLASHAGWPTKVPGTLFCSDAAASQLRKHALR